MATAKKTKKSTGAAETGAKPTRKRSLKALIPKEPNVPAFANPRDELRYLVRQHAATTKAIVAMLNRCTDKKLASGEISKCLLPDDVAAAMLGTAKEMQLQVDALERKMTAQLKRIPIYQHFLSKVFGAGPIASSYLIAYVDVTRAVKVSQLQRYCGLAVIDGRLERMTAKEVRKYNATLRVKLYAMFAAMWKSAARYSKTCKYLEIWRNKRHGYESTGRKGGHKAGWHVAARVFLEDLYIVWRTLEGLDVWPSYHAAQMGYAHGGKVCVNQPKMLTLDEALAIVGDVGGRHVERPAESIDEVEDAAE